MQECQKARAMERTEAPETACYNELPDNLINLDDAGF